MNTIEIDEGQDNERLRALMLWGLLILYEWMAAFRLERKFLALGGGGSGCS